MLTKSRPFYFQRIQIYRNACVASAGKRTASTTLFAAFTRSYKMCRNVMVRCSCRKKWRSKILPVFKFLDARRGISESFLVMKS